MKSIKKFVNLLEDSLLISLLITMIILSSSQILLRNFFDIGIIWIDPLLRVLVLWAGLIGATVASRENKHIQIDLFSRIVNKRLHLVLKVIVGFITSFVCAVIAWFGSQWVLLDYHDKLTSFSGVPSWTLEIIIPIAFGLISIRYLLHCVCWTGALINIKTENTCPL